MALTGLSIRKKMVPLLLLPVKDIAMINDSRNLNNGFYFVKRFEVYDLSITGRGISFSLPVVCFYLILMVLTSNARKDRVIFPSLTGISSVTFSSMSHT